LSQLIQRSSGEHRLRHFYLKCKGGWRSEAAQIEITNAAQARPAIEEGVAFAKKIIASPGGAEAVNKAAPHRRGAH
jgi:hypothetical protein